MRIDVLSTPPESTPKSPPLLLALQQLAVGGDLDVQRQLEVHQLLVFADLSRHVLLGPPQGVLHLADVLPGLLQVVVAPDPDVVDFLLQGIFLAGEQRGEGKIRGRLDGQGARLRLNSGSVYVS